LMRDPAIWRIPSFTRMMRLRRIARRQTSGRSLGPLVGKRIAFRVGERKANDHPAAGTGSLSGHHAIVLLGESENEPGSRTAPYVLRAADAVVFADKDQMLGSFL